MADLRVPLVSYIVEGVGINERKADEEDICVRVGERPQTIVVVLTSCIPEPQADRPTIDEYICCVVVKTGRKKKSSISCNSMDSRIIFIIRTETSITTWQYISNIWLHK